MSIESLLSTANFAATDKWLFGDELFAFDSKIYQPGEFVDYTGKRTIASNRAIAATTNYPIRFEDPEMPYGGGIVGYTSGIYTDNGLIPSNFLALNEWSVDFWLRETVASSGTQRIPFTLLASYPDITTATTYTNRLMISGGTDSAGKMHLWNNGQAPAKLSTWNTQPYFGVDWKHCLLSYKDGIYNFYVNALRIGQIAWTNRLPTGEHQIGFVFQDYASSGARRAVIERYRLRPQALYTEASFNLNHIYPHGL